MKDSEPIYVSHDPWLDRVNASAFRSFMRGLVPGSTTSLEPYRERGLLRLGILPITSGSGLLCAVSARRPPLMGRSVVSRCGRHRCMTWFPRLCRADAVVRQDTPITRRGTVSGGVTSCARENFWRRQSAEYQ